MKLRVVFGLSLAVFSLSLFAQTSSIKCVGCERDERGKIKRSEAAKKAFRKNNPCPVTGKTKGACPGYEIDHKQPLYQGGSDTPDNMQWLDDQAHKAKHSTLPPASNSASASSSSSSSTSNSTSSSDKTTYTGPRGGKYHYSSSGHKVYERRRR